MRNFICVMSVLAGMCLGFYFVNSQYVKECIVVDVNNDIVTIQTEQGDYFEFFGDGFTAGDSVKVTFNDNETIGINDDFIIDCEICTKKI